MLSILSVLLFFFNAGGPSAFYTLSLHVALPIWLSVEELERLQAALQHPLRFVLQRGDVAHDLFAQTTPGGGPGSVVVMPSIGVVAHGVDDLVLGELFWCARHGVLPSVSGM